jgi:hypothetical protein
VDAIGRAAGASRGRRFQLAMRPISATPIAIFAKGIDASPGMSSPSRPTAIAMKHQKPYSRSAGFGGEESEVIASDSTATPPMLLRE